MKRWAKLEGKTQIDPNQKPATYNSFNLFNQFARTKDKDKVSQKINKPEIAKARIIDIESIH